MTEEKKRGPLAGKGEPIPCQGMPPTREINGANKSLELGHLKKKGNQIERKTGEKKKTRGKSQKTRPVG